MGENARSEKATGVGKGGISKRAGSVDRSVGFIGRRARALPTSHLRARRFQGRPIGGFLERRPSREQPFRGENASSEKATGVGKGGISKRLGFVARSVGFIGRRSRALRISHLRARRFQGRLIGRFTKRRPSRDKPFRNENARSEKATGLGKGEISKRLESVDRPVGFVGRRSRARSISHLRARARVADFREDYPGNRPIFEISTLPRAAI